MNENLRKVLTLQGPCTLEQIAVIYGNLRLDSQSLMDDLLTAIKDGLVQFSVAEQGVLYRAFGDGSSI